MTREAQALALWGMRDAQVTFVAARENTVYRVDHEQGVFALRFHRKGYRTDAQLGAELDWMARLHDGGLSVPAPVRSLSGHMLERVDGFQVDVLTWLDGDTFEAVLDRADPAQQRAMFFALGRTMAQLHDVSDAWPHAAHCTRPSWDCDGLLGETPLWDRFWDNPDLSADEKAMFLEFRRHAAHVLQDQGKALDYGLIHADLVPVNVMWTGTSVHVIDFDDGGFGYRVFEVATALLKHRAHPQFAQFQEGLIEGYTSQRSLSMDHLPLFLALRAMTYVGWNITRMKEDATGARNARFIQQAKSVLQAYYAT